MTIIHWYTGTRVYKYETLEKKKKKLAQVRGEVTSTSTSTGRRREFPRPRPSFDLYMRTATATLAFFFLIYCSTKLRFEQSNNYIDIFLFQLKFIKKRVYFEKLMLPIDFENIQ